MRLRILGFVLVLAVVFAAPAFATGNGSSQTVYDNAGTKVQGIVTKGTTQTAVAGTKTGGTLPFTGLDLGLMVAAGLVLVGTGLSLRWLTRQRPTK